MRISDWSSDVCSSDLEFAALDLDVAVVAAYGLILPRPILDAPRDGCLNVHGSILPRWRGRSEERRVGKECVGTCRSQCRWSRYRQRHEQTTTLFTAVTRSVLS